VLDIQIIRDKPDFVRGEIAKLGAEAPIDAILQHDAARRETLQELETLRNQRNVTSEQIGQLKDQEQRDPLIEEMRGVNERIKVLEQNLRTIDQDLREAMLLVPNLPHASVTEGADESENTVVSTHGDPKSAKEFGFEPRPHWELGPDLGIIDFERGVKLSGSRFYVMLGMGSRLQRALINWMLDMHVSENGYTEVAPPYMVKEDMMRGAGQLPKFKDNIYRDAEEDFWFIGTAEIPLTNLHRDEILAADELPKKYVAFTPCFRREKFSAGRDVRGIKRGHQFDKVEMYQFVRPEDSYGALEQLVEQAAGICRALDIPYRVVEMVTGDLGFTAAKKYDLELWAPGSGEWLEVSSCSNCESFQARRANVRYRPEDGGGTEYVHTLNGSALALPRTVIAILENYQQEDGSVQIPEVIRPYMGGTEFIQTANPS
jgi:seryl-tRNA synthetase